MLTMYLYGNSLIFDCRYLNAKKIYAHACQNGLLVYKICVLNHSLLFGEQICICCPDDKHFSENLDKLSLWSCPLTVGVCPCPRFSHGNYHQMSDAFWRTVPQTVQKLDIQSKCLLQFTMTKELSISVVIIIILTVLEVYYFVCARSE